MSLDSEKIVPLDKLAVVATVATFVENEKIIAFFRFFDDEDDSGHKTHVVLKTRKCIHSSIAERHET